MNSWIQNHKFLLDIFPACLIAFMLTGCTYIKEGFRNDDLLNWKYSELRIVDPQDDIDPDQDIVAVYTRLTSQSFQIRIDFLELDDTFRGDVYIALDTNPGGNHDIKTDGNGYFPSDIDWDYLIDILALKKFDVYNASYMPSPGMEALIVFDPAQDRMMISLPRSYLPIYMGRTNIQVFITKENAGTISDKSTPAAIDASPPPRAKVLFIFWNAFSGASPAETLRSWAGAHSGPISSRHGLRYLLDAADRTKTTIFLVDALTQDNLSAFDYIKVMPFINLLVNKGYLLFYSLEDINIYLRENGYTYIKEIKTVCNSDISDGIKNNSLGEISIECKKLLLMQASIQSPTPLLLGGDLSKSLLGSPSGSLSLFSYIQAHPWIEVVTADEFSSLDPQSIFDTTQYQGNQAYMDGYERLASGVQEEISSSLVAAPVNPISALAFNVYASITQPFLPDLLALNPNYIGQIGEIIQAAYWADQPAPIETCDIDLDYDGSAECILSNEKIFAVIEPQGGYIPFVFSINDKGVHQIIGPTWEFMLGISDISTWRPDLGVRADMKQILGAFQDQFSDWNSYTPIIKEHVIELHSDDLTIQKSISLSSKGIHLEIVGIKDTNQIHDPICIPLAIDPWLRYLPGWRDFYLAESFPPTYSWGIDNGVMVEIASSTPYLAYSFKDSEELLLQPEDPNFNYPPGHYLPYPMALIEITPSASISVDIVLK